jgi:NosR/NirI family transcriptional regulator, nitrous oxide reductase regulator
LTNRSTHRKRRLSLHAFRVLLFCSILLLIHWQQRNENARQPAQTSSPAVARAVLQRFYPEAQALAQTARGDGGWDVLDSQGDPIGYVLQTSPQSDHILGFSGPTNVLVAFDPGDRILGVHILSSGDTRDHVRQVVRDDVFLQSFAGLTWDEAARLRRVDAVSGATLTSLAMVEAIVHRLGGAKPSLRFPDPLEAAQVAGLFPEAVQIVAPEARSGLWSVRDAAGQELGRVLRTGPLTEDVIGYQGPTDALIGLDRENRIAGVLVGKSYDNEPYTDYVRDDDYFLSLFNEQTIADLAVLDLDEAQVEGVSGATMTSLAVAEGLVQAAQEHRQAAAVTEQSIAQSSERRLSNRDLGTAVVVLGGLIIGFTSLRGQVWVRLPFQAVVIGYLGFINGDLVSQASLVGWAQHGVPGRNAAGLVLLTVAALAVPIMTKTNVYCSHLCPHGVAQQWLRNRLPWRVRLSRRIARGLSLIPGLLLIWVVVVALTGLPFSLVDIEPFDAYVFRVAGWATLTVAGVGLIASLFVPMAYCRFGCPTGALLGFLRYHAGSHRVTVRDALAVACLIIALGLFWMQ